jgi:hypothetical protein
LPGTSRFSFELRAEKKPYLLAADKVEDMFGCVPQGSERSGE